jgi:hypothetical protein
MEQLEPARSLDEIYKTLSVEPLINKEEFDAFYKKDLNEIRGIDKMGLIALDLKRSFGAGFYKAFVMGHWGVGKSTEFTRLSDIIKDRYSVIRFSVKDELDPSSFQPFDVLVWMMIEISRRTALPIEQGGAGEKPSESLLKKFLEWFDIEEKTIKKMVEAKGSVSAGAGVTGDSLWAKISGLFASLKAEMQISSVREEKVVKYRLSKLSDLIEMANAIIEDCNDIMKKKTSREWLFIGEDFEKEGVAPEPVSILFTTYSNVLKLLHCHMIFTIPIDLGFSEKSAQLPIPMERRILIPDSPVYCHDLAPHEKGRKALQSVLEARVNASCFSENQMMRLIVASGGNLRDLFSLVVYASNLAIMRKNISGRIEKQDVDEAILMLRSEFEGRLGKDPHIEKQVTYEDKVKKLMEIYEQNPISKIRDEVLYSLFRSRAVQEFDTRKWFGIHPVVVEILAEQGHIKRSEEGLVPGGTI